MIDYFINNYHNLFGRISRSIRNQRHRLTFPFPSYFTSHNCIFIHIPKVAGTSILNALGKKTTSGRLHLPWYVYYQSDRAYFLNAFKFAFVRNPWDRVYSAYNYLRSFDHDSIDLFRSFLNFDDFVINGLGDGLLRNHIILLPQSEFVLGPKGEIIVDFLGNFENLDTDFLVVARKLGIKSQLPKGNRTDREFENYKQAYTKYQSIDIIEQIYKQDCRVFGYSFE